MGLASEGSSASCVGFLGCFSCECGSGAVGSVSGLLRAAVRCVYPRLPKVAVGITAEVRREGVVYGG